MKTIDVITIMMWYQNNDTKERLSTLPLKTQWIIRKNIKILDPIYSNFIEFRDELTRKRNETWFVEDNGKCDKIEEEGKDPILKIKDEYMEEFTKYDDDLNSQIREIVEEENEVSSLQAIDVDDLINTIGEDCGLEVDDLEALELMGVN